MPRRRAHTLSLTFCVLVLAAGAAAFPAGAQDAVATSSKTPTERIDDLALPAVNALAAAQREDGTFADPVKGRVGGGGMPQVAWVALRQAARLDGEAARRRLLLARRTMRRGANDSQLLPKWPLALLVLDGAHGALDDGGRWQKMVTNLGRLRAPGVANACYRDGRCFNNYDLVSAVLNLELARSGRRSSVKGARLHDRALRRHTLDWLRDRLPPTTSFTARLSQPGLGERPMAALSDPSTYPLAYHVFSSALLTRAVALGGHETPAAVTRLLRHALWQLVAFTGPNGETSWMGRGQDQVWTLAAAAYAGMQGSVLLARSDRALSARLRRLADAELTALDGRLGVDGLHQTPLGRAGRAGIDHYACSVGNAAHALVWLELARDVAPHVRGARRALPAETPGARASDPRSTGLMTLRTATTWIGVHRRRSHRSDERYDFGLLRALVRGADGTWTSLLPARPIVRPGSASAPSGPLLARGGRVSEPVASAGGVSATAARLAGAWRGAAGVARGAWSWTPARGGVTMRSSCPRGAALRLTIWLPADGPLRRSARGLARGGYSVALSQAFKMRAQPGRYASAREPRLTAYRIATPCSGRTLAVRYAGAAVAIG
ncbi:MAG TPA: hypothetical protein VGO80_10545 [Solirubrobacteraceae bacterium]|jgi:hypothetical protein|nr:hypothetical protein [Solirubrobacteraceae bacterium]